VWCWYGSENEAACYQQCCLHSSPKYLVASRQTNLSRGGLSWAPTHVQAHAFSRLLQSSFQINMALVLPLSLQSAIYSCPRITSRFFESVVTASIMMLAYNTQEIMKLLVSEPVRCHVWHWEFATPVYVAIYCCCRQQFCTIITMPVLIVLITSSEWLGWTFVCAHVQISRAYLVSTLDVTHVVKCTRLFPSSAGRAWERGYHLFIELLNQQADVTNSCH